MGLASRIRMSLIGTDNKIAWPSCAVKALTSEGKHPLVNQERTEEVGCIQSNCRPLALRGLARASVLKGEGGPARNYQAARHPSRCRLPQIAIVNRSECNKPLRCAIEQRAGSSLHPSILSVKKIVRRKVAQTPR
jgi:hypothetical protein